MWSPECQFVSSRKGASRSGNPIRIGYVIAKDGHLSAILHPGPIRHLQSDSLIIVKNSYFCRWHAMFSDDPDVPYYFTRLRSLRAQITRYPVFRVCLEAGLETIEITNG
jgi:hypothetical protein